MHTQTHTHTYINIELYYECSSLPTSIPDTPKQAFRIAHAATTTFYQQHTFYHTSVLDTCIDVSKRAVFRNCVNGRWRGGGAILGLEAAGFYEWVKRFCCGKSCVRRLSVICMCIQRRCRIFPWCWDGGLCYGDVVLAWFRGWGRRGTPRRGGVVRNWMGCCCSKHVFAPCSVMRSTSLFVPYRLCRT
jgi:hypothetical protein